jgi:hypothetical protein
MTKAPHTRSFRRCAEEDSNLHPGYPGPGPQPCHPGVRYVPYVHSVQIVRVSGRNGRDGRSGCCRGCCHGPQGPLPLARRRTRGPGSEYPTPVVQPRTLSGAEGTPIFVAALIILAAAVHPPPARAAAGRHGGAGLAARELSRELVDAARRGAGRVGCGRCAGRTRWALRAPRVGKGCPCNGRDRGRAVDRVASLGGGPKPRAIQPTGA